MIGDVSKPHADAAADPMYSSGAYYQTHSRYARDAAFKAQNFLDVFLPLAREHAWRINSYVDVGCGSGDIAAAITQALRHAGHDVSVAKGYDVSPHVQELNFSAVEFVHADFCESGENADLVTLFDVFEHVTDPLRFIGAVRDRCRIVGFHIPLDNSLNHALRDKYKRLLKEPGHLIFLDAASALNLLTLAGLRVVGYCYTFGFLAPSGRRSFYAKALFPVRYLLANLSPWLLSKTLGGASLLVVAITPRGLRAA